MTVPNSLDLLSPTDRALVRATVAALRFEPSLVTPLQRLVRGLTGAHLDICPIDLLAVAVLRGASTAIWRALTKARPWHGSSKLARTFVADLVCSAIHEGAIDEDTVMACLPEEALTRALRGTELHLVMACVSPDAPFLKLLKAIVSVDALVHRLPPLLLWSEVVLGKLAPRALIEDTAGYDDDTITMIRSRARLDSNPPSGPQGCAVSCLDDLEGADGEGETDEPTLRWAKRTQSGIEHC